jgi:hypothetical protein
MGTIQAALQDLDDDARSRVLAWATDRFDAKPHETVESRDGQTQTAGRFAEVADLIEAARPTTGPERAIAVAYWLQEFQGRSGGWTGAEVNDALRNLGHGLANVTKTLSSQMARRPQLVMQVGKSGRSRQARKTYKLTTAGVAAAQEMISRSRDEVSR